MSWHQSPKDDAWRQVHLAYLVERGQQAWLHCTACSHQLMVAPAELAERHSLSMTLPLLSIARRLVCTKCGARKAHCWPKPYAIGDRTTAVGEGG